MKNIIMFEKDEFEEKLLQLKDEIIWLQKLNESVSLEKDILLAFGKIFKHGQE
jgi:hypothetical protein